MSFYRRTRPISEFPSALCAPPYAFAVFIISAFKMYTSVRNNVACTHGGPIKYEKQNRNISGHGGGVCTTRNEITSNKTRRVCPGNFGRRRLTNFQSGLDAIPSRTFCARGHWSIRGLLGEFRRVPGPVRGISGY